MAKKQGGRLLSSAGLVNYYESEDRRAVHISPVTVMAVAAVGWYYHFDPGYHVRNEIVTSRYFNGIFFLS